MLVEVSDCLSRAQAARRLGLSGERVYQLARSGELVSIRTPYGRVYPAAAVEELDRRRAERGAPAPGSDA